MLDLLSCQFSSSGVLCDPLFDLLFRLGVAGELSSDLFFCMEPLRLRIPPCSTGRVDRPPSPLALSWGAVRAATEARECLA